MGVTKKSTTALIGQNSISKQALGNCMAPEQSELIGEWGWVVAGLGSGLNLPKLSLINVYKRDKAKPVL